MPERNAGPITSLSAPQQQHMLFLFFPLRAGAGVEASDSIHEIFSAVQPTNGAAANEGDLRTATGVHYFMAHHVTAGTKSPLPVPTFTAANGKDLLVVMSIYDRDFAPYISAFTSNAFIAFGLNGIIGLMDERGIVEPSDPSSAAFIIANGGVAKNNPGFLKLLMRYNFADPRIAAGSGQHPLYVLGATFPGLTVARILQNYPDAVASWPTIPSEITFGPAAAPPN